MNIGLITSRIMLILVSGMWHTAICSSTTAVTNQPTTKLPPVSEVARPSLVSTMATFLQRNTPSIEEVRSFIKEQPILIVGSACVLASVATLLGLFTFKKSLHVLGYENLPPAPTDPERYTKDKLGKKIEHLHSQHKTLSTLSSSCSSSDEQEDPLLPTIQLLIAGNSTTAVQTAYIIYLQNTLAELEKNLLNNAWKDETTWNTILQQQPKPVGLANNGATCYRNATLQALHHLYPQIYKECIEAEIKDPQLITNQTFQDFKSFARSRTLGNLTGHQNLKTEFESFEKLCADYFNQTYQQEDADEFLTKLLTNSPENPAGLPLCNALGTAETLTNKTTQESTTKIMLSLPKTKAPSNALTLTQLFENNFGKTEKIDEEKITRTQTLTKTPNNLCIQIVRFETSYNGVKKPSLIKQKRDDKITIPLEFKIPKTCFSQDVKEQEKNDQYRLKSVICHLGTLDGGHYIAYVYHKNTWYRCDDSSSTEAKKITAETALNLDKISGTPYILFYEKN